MHSGDVGVGAWQAGAVDSGPGWDERLFALFDDLEAQAAVLYDAEREAELADRGRSEYAGVTLASRLMASVGTPLRVQIAGVGVVDGELRRVGPDWLLLTAEHADWVVLTSALESVVGASPRSVPEIAWPRIASLGVGSALRRLADAAEPCVWHARDAGAHEGVVRRVGRDFVEVHLVTGATCLLPWSGLAAVQSRR